MTLSPFGPMRVIVNPRAGRGAVERGWPAARAVLDEAGVVYEVTVTEGPGHGTEAAREAVRAGTRFVVAVGGDGTVHEVVNGLMSAPPTPESILGVVGAGSGCDFVKTFGLPADPAEAARHLLGDSLWGRIDVLRLSYLDPSGAPAVRWCANISEVGLGAEVVAIAARMPKWLGASVYRIAAVRGIIRHRSRPMRIAMHGRKARGARTDAPLGDLVVEATASMIVVAGGQFFGGGMRVAPRANPGDGLADVLVFTGPKGQAARTMPKMFKGDHVPHPGIAEYLATRVELDADSPVLLEADGEVIGTTPVTFEVVPGALALKV